MMSHLKPPGQELVLDLKEVTLADIHLEGLVDDGESDVVLDVLPAAIAMGHNASE